ncbi:hypothetical protein ACS0TY_027858 [Phlomoides rotata]
MVDVFVYDQKVQATNAIPFISFSMHGAISVKHYYYLFLFLYFVVIKSHVFAEKSLPNRDFPTHFNFLRGRKGVLWCANDPNVCSDPERNPWGGTTCCSHRFCKDILNDPNHCGSCDRVCGFGFICCGGNCVDTRNDHHHCGACFEECPRGNKCTYSMCDYGG